MRIFVLGLNHKSASIEVRERFALKSEDYSRFTRIVGNRANIFELAPLSTCHRIEIYGVARDENFAKSRVMEGLGDMSRLLPEHFSDSIYFKTQAEAVYHLFSVAAGLDSMVLGENEILSQVKKAYTRAHKDQMTGKILNILFQKSLGVGKKVRTLTNINSGKLSLASIAVDLSEKIFFKIAEKKVVCLGAGEVSRQLCQALTDKGVTDLSLTSRTLEHAEALASTLSGHAFDMAGLDAKMREADILLASLSASPAVITLERVAAWMKSRNGRQLFIIDLGLPRNIDAKAGALPDTYLYNVDDLKFMSDQVLLERKAAILEAEKIIYEATSAAMNRLKNEFQEVFYE